MKELSPGDALIIPGYRLNYASGPVFHYFQQNNSLYYLTGFNEPDCLAVFEKLSYFNENAKRDYKMTLFMQQNTDFTRRWTGPKCGTENAVNYFKADEVWNDLMEGS